MERNPRSSRDEFACRERNESVRGDVSDVPQRKNCFAAKLRLLSALRRMTCSRDAAGTQVLFLGENWPWAPSARTSLAQGAIDVRACIFFVVAPSPIQQME